MEWRLVLWWLGGLGRLLDGRPIVWINFSIAFSWFSVWILVSSRNNLIHGHCKRRGSRPATASAHQLLLPRTKALKLSIKSALNLWRQWRIFIFQLFLQFHFALGWILILHLWSGIALCHRLIVVASATATVSEGVTLVNIIRFLLLLEELLRLFA